MATIKEVAQHAGVSTATVSRFINGTGVVKEQKAERISEAIETLNYYPNLQARNLRTTRTNYILVLVPSIENSFLSRVIRGIQKVGNQNGYSIILGITYNNFTNEQAYLDLVKSRGVDGIITIAPTVGEDVVKKLYREYPILQCSEYCTQDIPYITVDNYAAAYEITELLIVSGCHRLALISSDLDIISFKEREAGFFQALVDHSIPFDCELEVRVPLGFIAGKKATKNIMKRHPDGIFAVADILALGAIRQILDAGLDVPGDVKVAGFDGIPLSRELQPSLTTVIQPAYDMGKMAAQLIIEMIEGHDVEKRTVLPYRIISRRSTEK
jgi:LacI family repressor for deo operon, udp, cdd, tsx, nupC, and nupG